MKMTKLEWVYQYGTIQYSETEHSYKIQRDEATHLAQDNRNNRNNTTL